MGTVRDNTAASRFELEAEGVTAFITYTRGPGAITLVHEEVPKEASGKGLGSALAKGALELIGSRGEKVIPACPFVAAYMLRHKETQRLLADPDYFHKHGH